MMRTRAERRAKLAAMKEKAKRVYPHYPKAAHIADYLAHCSRPCCSGSRKFHGPAHSERRALITADEA